MKWEYKVYSKSMPNAETVRQEIKSAAEQNWELVSVFPNPYISSLLFPFMFVFKREIPKPDRLPPEEQQMLDELLLLPPEPPIPTR